MLNEQEAKETQEAAPEATFEEVADQVDQETVEESSPSEKPEGTEEESGTDQQKPEELDSDVPKEFHNHPAWKRIMGERDKTKAEYEAKEKELEELISKDPEPYNPSDEELTELASTRGYKLDKAEQEAVAKIDELQGMLDKVANPQERDWWKNYGSAIEKKILSQLSEKYDKPLNQFTQIAINHKLEKSEQQAKDHIKTINEKHGTTIDFKKDVEPELKKMISVGMKDGSINKYNTDIFQLTKGYLAEHGIEFGKRISEKQQREMNEKKKQANVESTGINSAPKVDFEKMSFEDIMEYTDKESA